MRFGILISVVLIGCAVITVLLVRFREDMIAREHTTPIKASVPVDPNFQNWLAEQATQIDENHLDRAAKKDEIKQMLEVLSEIQSQQLELAAQDANTPSNVRIFSLYLLVQAGTKAEHQLLNYIASPLAPGAQERSLRLMAINGAVSELKTAQSGSRKLILKAFSEIPDAELREYALKASRSAAG